MTELALDKAQFPLNGELLDTFMDELAEFAEAVSRDDYHEAKQQALRVSCIALRVAIEGDARWSEKAAVQG